MYWVLSTHGKESKYRKASRKRPGDLGVAWRKILKWIILEQVARMWMSAKHLRNEFEIFYLLICCNESLVIIYKRLL